ncbi:uncharacterized protein cubi_02104 [Cryptosporidium ubiquitum]|uniref:Uncharacterized protein n=1 Tax=Cryptosporidium ubiquitum TaxID=857276 RepID=A0A1J4MNH5_9CRYT|nr:uncharacterized protein cubi_02104 [Cryptosporidium ubiquitum]OII75583.1 hypothetical protein cubi_02104 [Cryptosporidium ubiquitum]
MTILVDGQALSVTDLFKKYDLDEISDILVRIKKEIFVRTNEVKKVIGSNPDLMIDFGQNVLNIYNASTKLNSSTYELLKDIERFSDSLGDKVSKFVQEELPDVIRKEDLNSILSHQEQHEKLYFGILESFSKKSFIQSYELYLEYKKLINEDSSNLENTIFKDSIFIKQSISSNCYTFIQSCEKLNSVELAQLIMIRYLLEIEGKHTDHLEHIESDFKTILETALILRVDKTIQILKNARISCNSNLGKKEEFNDKLGQTFMMAMTVLVDLYELKESISIVCSEFKQRGWFELQFLDHISACLLTLTNSSHISRLMSVLLEEFGSMGGEKVVETNNIENGDVYYSKKSEEINHNFRFKFLSKIYLNLFSTIKHGVGIEILKNSFFPILISTIEEELIRFLIIGNKNQLLELILRPEEDIESYYNRKMSNIFEDNNTIRWLISKNESFEILINEIKETGELLDKVEPSEKNSILRSISEKCFSSILTKFIEFNRILFWSIKGRDFKQAPTILVKNEDDSMAKIHRFSNILIQGKQLEFLESSLIEYLSTGQEEFGFSYQILTQDNNIGPRNINWEILVRICSEIIASLEDSSQVNEESKNTQTLILCSLREFTKSYVSPECLFRHIQSIRTLETIIYSLMIHREELCQKICTYQSLLQRTNDKLESNCLNSKEVLSLTSLYHQFGFIGDNSVTPHTLLLEFCFDLNMISTQLAFKSQRSIFNLVCRSYIKSYILPFQINIIKTFGDLYLKLGNLKNDENFNKELKDDDKDLLVKSVSCLYSDLIWCERFSVCNYSIEHDNGVSINSKDELSPTMDIVKTILTPEDMVSIEDGIISLLKEARENYNLEACHQLPKVQNLFASSVQRFPTLPLVNPSSRGSISNKITTANDKTLKANIDSNSVSANNDYRQFLLTHYSDILKNYNKSDSIRLAPKVSSVVNSQDSINNTSNPNFTEEKIGGWFSMGNGNQNVETSSNIHLNDNNTGSFANNSGTGVMGINKKIDTQAIWQVSNLLKETVKDKVFGQ